MSEPRIIRRERFPHIPGEYQYRDDGTYRFVGEAKDGFGSDYIGTYTMTPAEREEAGRLAKEIA